MATNVSVEYTEAEKLYFLAQNDEEKLIALQKMLSYVPGHKGAENLRADLRARIKKLKEKLIEKKKKGKGKRGIKKAEMQACLIGLTNSGKSSLLSAITNAKPLISEYEFTTKQPTIGTLDYENVKIQIIDMPSIDYETFDSGIANSSDVLIIVITKTQDLEKILSFLEKSSGNKLFVFNKSDLLDEKEKRKITAFLSSKKLNFVLFSSKTLENIEELKEKLWKSFNKIRIYTKQPHQQADKEPVIMPQNSNVKDVAEKIFHGLSSQVKEARVTGPSSKFPNQKVSLSHQLKDKDIVEFYTSRLFPRIPNRLYYFF